MRNLRSLIVAAALAVSVGASAQSGSQPNSNVRMRPVALPLPATALLSRAEADAKASGKNVFVIFHASWCIWCKRLDEFMNDPRYKPVFDDNFVITKIDVQEDDKHKLEENPGGDKVMDQLGGQKAGLPLFAIVDPNGNMIINSMRPVEGKDPENTGCPGSPEEIAYFGTMMQKGAPHITGDQIKAMSDYLAAQQAAREAAAKAKAGGH